MLKLYKIVNGEIRLMDYGVESKREIYIKSGFMIDDNNIFGTGHLPVYEHARKEFNLLWDTLGVAEKLRLADIPVEDEMSIYEKLDQLKAEIIVIKRREKTWYPKAGLKSSIGRTVRGFLTKISQSITSMVNPMIMTTS